MTGALRQAGIRQSAFTGRVVLWVEITECK